MKKSISIILALFIVFYATGSVFADNLTEAQKKLNNVNSSISDKSSKIKEINKSSEVVKKDLNQLNSQMDTVSQKLTSINTQITDINSKIAKTEEELKISEKKLKDEQDICNVRLRSMYMQGNMGYMEVLLSSTSFSDLVSRMEIVKKIIDYDKSLIESLNKDRVAVQVKKGELQEKKKQSVSLKKQSDIQYTELKNKSQQKNELMGSLNKDKNEYEKMLAVEKAESENIQKMIAEIKKAAEEASRNQNNNNNNNNNNNSNSNNHSNDSKPNMNGNIACVTGRVYGITSSYGYRMHPVLGRQIFHSGLDIGVPMGTPVYSLKSGTVVYSGGMSGYGNVVMVSHGDFITLYAHCSSLAVSKGQAVAGGQLIAYSGNSGMSTGPHLHFEIRNNGGGTMDPTPYYR